MSIIKGTGNKDADFETDWSTPEEDEVAAKRMYEQAQGLYILDVGSTISLLTAEPGAVKVITSLIKTIAETGWTTCFLCPAKIGPNHGPMIGWVILRPNNDTLAVTQALVSGICRECYTPETIQQKCIQQIRNTFIKDARVIDKLNISEPGRA